MDMTLGEVNASKGRRLYTVYQNRTFREKRSSRRIRGWLARLGIDYVPEDVASVTLHVLNKRATMLLQKLDYDARCWYT